MDTKLPPPPPKPRLNKIIFGDDRGWVREEGKDNKRVDFQQDLFHTTATMVAIKISSKLTGLP